MVKVKMIRSTTGSPNGLVVDAFMKDKEYLIDKQLADVFVRQLKCAEYVTESIIAPQNKMVQGPGTNKHKRKS